MRDEWLFLSRVFGIGGFVAKMIFGNNYLLGYFTIILIKSSLVVKNE